MYLLCIQRRIQKWIQSRVFAQPSGNRRCVSGGISSRILVATVDTGGYIGYTSDTHRIRVSGVSDGYARILPDTGKNTCRIQTQYTWIRSYSITKGTIFDNKRHFSRPWPHPRHRIASTTCTSPRVQRSPGALSHSANDHPSALAAPISTQRAGIVVLARAAATSQPLQALAPCHRLFGSG